MRWGVVALILLSPLVAMQITDEVRWDAADFAIASLLLIGTGLAFELALRRVGDNAYRAAAGLALVAGLILVWVNGAVGIIGSENNDANLMYGGVLAIGLVGALIARFQPRGMALALAATALAQTIVAVITLVAGLGYPATGPVEIVMLNGFFVALFLGSALLFREAAQEGRERGAG